jgi:hypothetical protein
MIVEFKTREREREQVDDCSDWMNMQVDWLIDFCKLISGRMLGLD